MNKLDGSMGSGGSARQPSQEIDRCVRIRDAAALEGVSITDIRRRIYRGELGYIRLGRLIVIPLSELERWRRRHYVPPVSPAGGDR
jgi:excisionase family DNA binding protein